MKLVEEIFASFPQPGMRHFFWRAEPSAASGKSQDMSAHFSLRCRECHRDWGHRASSICEDCLAPLEVQYDMEFAQATFTRENIAKRPANLWRYAELLPLPEGYRPDLPVGMTPLVTAPRLGARQGARHAHAVPSRGARVCAPRPCARWWRSLAEMSRAALAIVRSGRKARPATSQPSQIEITAMIASATPESIRSW